MQKTRKRHLKIFFIAFLGLFFFGGKPIEFGQEKNLFHGFLIHKPVIRVGLGVNLGEISVLASSGMKVYEVGENYRLLADDVDNVRIKGHREELTEKFVLEVFQTDRREEAERLAVKLRQQIDQQVYVAEAREEDIDSSFQVRIGDFLTRGEALSFIKKINQLGIKDAWIIREEVTGREAKPLWVLVNDELKSLNEETVLYFVPTHPESFLSYKGRKYRGIFVLKATRKGLALVNILNLENYLKGVVPCELSPYQFNNFEALKAQAVAARTYAMKNMGLYGDLGFDICDTPHCQVYKGLSAEHPLSSRAVEETRGEVAVFNGKLINALYTSTCGGMTENVENVFGGNALAYLRSIECTYEKQKEWLIESPSAALSVVMSGKNIEREIAFLTGLDIIPLQTDPAFYRENASFEEAVRWIEKAVTHVGKDGKNFPSETKNLNFSSLATLMVDAFQWRDRVQNLMLKSEVDFILKDYPHFNHGSREDVAYLLHSGIFHSWKGLDDESRIVTRAELAYVLFKMIGSYKDPSRRGVFLKLVKNGLEVEENGAVRTVALSPGIFLVKNYGGERALTSRLSLLGGEEMSWLENRDEVRLLEVNFPAESDILDRASPFNRWQVRQSRKELQKRINEYYPIGELNDVIVEKRGESRRATEVSIIGSESTAVVKGLKIRWVLGLRDTLFTIDRERGEDGQVTHFTFSGRGWGHGVGLCQVGAFRMAQAGANYKEVLKKYYKGVKINKTY